jgi:hypothetical protein
MSAGSLPVDLDVPVLFVILSLPLGCQTPADDTNHVSCTFSEANEEWAITRGMADYDFTVLLPTRTLIVKYESQRIAKHSAGFVKTNSMPSEIQRSLSGIPLELYTHIGLPTICAFV